MSELSENLKSARNATDLTQKDVAKKAGIAKSTYSLYESGKREPNIEMLKRISKILNVTPDVLIGVSNPMKPMFLTPQEEIVMNKYRSLSSLAKERLESLLDVEYKQLQRSKQDQ